MLTLTNFNLPHFILSFMIMSHKQLSFSYLLIKVFTHYGIGLGTETPHKESLGFTSINRIFLPRNNFNIIMNGGTKAEEDARLKKTHHGRIPGGKRKKVNIQEEEVIFVSYGSEVETSEKVVGLRVHSTIYFDDYKSHEVIQY